METKVLGNAFSLIHCFIHIWHLSFWVSDFLDMQDLLAQCSILTSAESLTALLAHIYHSNWWD